MSRDSRLHRTPLDVLEYEIVEEQAAALGRMGSAGSGPRQAAGVRCRPSARGRAGVSAAGTAYPGDGGRPRALVFVVQREACGLRNSRTLMRDYNVPGEVQKRMGPIYNRPLAQAS